MGHGALVLGRQPIRLCGCVCPTPREKVSRTCSAWREGLFAADDVQLLVTCSECDIITITIMTASTAPLDPAPQHDGEQPTISSASLGSTECGAAGNAGGGQVAVAADADASHTTRPSGRPPPTPPRAEASLLQQPHRLAIPSAATFSERSVQEPVAAAITRSASSPWANLRHAVEAVGRNTTAPSVVGSNPTFNRSNAIRR